jgi:hypothetical protein
MRSMRVLTNGILLLATSLSLFKTSKSLWLFKTLAVRVRFHLSSFHHAVGLRPGKPTDNAFIESFNGKFRIECLDVHWFMTLEDARTKLEALA